MMEPPPKLAHPSYDGRPPLPPLNKSSRPFPSSPDSPLRRRRLQSNLQSTDLNTSCYSEVDYSSNPLHPSHRTSETTYHSRGDYHDPRSPTRRSEQYNKSLIGPSYLAGDNMAPLSNSPPSQQHGQRSDPSQSSGSARSSSTPYPPPASRPPTVGAGGLPPSNFSGGRELPALSSLSRTGAGSSSMSIMSMLGGPAPSRDNGTSPLPPVNQEQSSGGPASSYGSMYASAHQPPTQPQQGYRRPRTPDALHRMPDARRSAAASPGAFTNPNMTTRFGTPQTYHVRELPPPDIDRTGRDTTTRPIPPPRPNSQPRSFASAPSTRTGLPDLYSRREEYAQAGRYDGEPHNRMPSAEEQRYLAGREREQLEREIEQRERDRRSRANSSSDLGRQVQRNDSGLSREAPGYGRQLESREQAYWQRQPLENSRPLFDEAGQLARHPEFARAALDTQFVQHVQHFERMPADGMPLPESRTQSTTQDSRPGLNESPERHRMVPPLHHTPGRRAPDERPPPPSIAYNAVAAGAPLSYESSRKRSNDESAPALERQRSYLGIQDMSRRGRASPLPQPVQGAQAQPQGPAGEPGIKSEFGRMFSGIGSGVSGFSPMSAGPQLHHSSNVGINGLFSDGIQMSRTESKTKRRKLKGEGGLGDDENVGRSTPLNKTTSKRPKTHGSHHHHHHHHHHRAGDQVSAPGGAPAPQLPPHVALHDMSIHHHHHAPQRTASRGPFRDSPMSRAAHILVPKPKQIVNNAAVLSSVANRPREHLGDIIYEGTVQPARLHSSSSSHPLRHGYESNPKPLPWNMICDKENSTATVKISKGYLVSAAREEVTARRAVWGTDIYTDDSDVLAACIHGGWIRGEWPDSIDTSLLDLEHKSNGALRQRELAAEGMRKIQSDEGLDKPPKSGPVEILPERDLHVKILILPLLEKYSSTTRYGLRSREFGGKLGKDGQVAIHDGLSFMILSVRYAISKPSAGVGRLRGKARRNRIRRAMVQVDIGGLQAAYSSATLKTTIVDKTTRELADKENKADVVSHGNEDAMLLDSDTHVIPKEAATSSVGQ